MIPLLIDELIVCAMLLIASIKQPCLLLFSSVLTYYICAFLYLIVTFCFPSILSTPPHLTIFAATCHCNFLFAILRILIVSLVTLLPLFVSAWLTLSDQYFRVGHYISRSFSTSKTYLTADLLIGPLIIFVIGILSMVILNISFLFKSVNQPSNRQLNAI